MADLPLGDLLEVLIDHRGKTPKKLGGVFVDSGVPVVSAVNLKAGRCVLDVPPRCVSDDIYARWMPVRLRKGDVLLTSEAPLGEVAQVPSDEPLVLGQRLFGLRGRSEVLDNGFLYYLLQWTPIQNRLQARATGTTVHGIRQAELVQVLVPTPPFAEQRAIAEVLGALDDKIEANGRTARACSDVAAVAFQIATEGETSLADVASVTMGQSPPGNTYNERGEGQPFYQGTRDFGFRHPRHRVWCTAPTRFADVTDVLVSVRAPVGRVNTAFEPCAIGRGLAAARSPFPSVLYQALTAEPWVWSPYESEGTVFGSVDKADLAGIRLPWPTTARRVAQLEETLAPLDRLLDASEREAGVLVELRDSLLPKLLSGKLRVRDAASLVKEAV